MKRIDSSKFVPSKLEGYEEVRYRLNKLTEGRSIELNLELSPFKAELRELMAEIESLQPKDSEDKPIPVTDPVVMAKIQNLQDKVSLLIQSKINPAWVKWGLKEVDGLEIDGQKITTADAFIESAPTELFQEVHELIRKEATLTPEESRP